MTVVVKNVLIFYKFLTQHSFIFIVVVAYEFLFIFLFFLIKLRCLLQSGTYLGFCTLDTDQTRMQYSRISKDRGKFCTKH